MTTHWPTVMQAGAEGPQRAAALDQVCRVYWYPVYAFIRRQGKSPEDAQDCTQAFFEKLLRRGWLDGIEKLANARFSTWLLTRVKTHLQNAHRDASTEKRGGSAQPLSIDLLQAENWYGAEPFSDESPERAFERRWALTVLDAALVRLRLDCAAIGKTELFEDLSPFLSREPERGEYQVLAAKLQVRENSVAVAVHRLRLQYRDAVRAELAAGLADPAMVEEELRHLAACL